jgi:hypothetical protein
VSLGKCGVASQKNAGFPPLVPSLTPLRIPTAAHGYADFYGWSEAKARQTATQPESQTFPPHLRARGFTFD